jgi:DNA adenine methylase
MLHFESLMPSFENVHPKSFVKWAGGKTQLLPELLKHIPEYSTYFEPFCGSGALLFALKPTLSFISDINDELMNCYEVIAEQPLQLLIEIEKMPIGEDFFYKLRAADRSPDFKSTRRAWRAARFIYLNKTCYNGLYRVNKQGQNNVPWGKYANPTLIDKNVLRDTAFYLKHAGIYISSLHWSEMFKVPSKGDFVYLDPPYDVVSDTANFTSYSKEKFGKQEYVELKTGVDDLTSRGIKVLQSNADTPFIRNLYKDYEIVEVQAKRNINSKGNKRGNVTELLIKNY